MSKFYSFSFSMLQKIMLGFMLHWFLVAIVRLSILSSLAFVISLFLAYFAYRSRKSLYHFYQRMMRHKKALMVAVVLFQLVTLLSAELLIRRDAAVVFTGAFHYLKESSISSYLTRNPNNLFLFLYERFFYNLFGTSALWILQILNLLYTDLTAIILYKGAKRFVNQAVANASFTLYSLLLGFSPYFYSMYTDIWPLPLIACQIFLVFGLLQDVQKQKSWIYRSLVFGVVSGLALLLRPTTIVLVIAAFLVLLLKKHWKEMLLLILSFLLAFSPVYLLGKQIEQQQKEVPIIQGEGLAKTPLLFINLGLTYTGNDQGDMKNGLLQYIDPDKRKEYNNGMFAEENVKKEIRRRLSEYTLPTFISHLIYKQSLTVAEGTLGWLYRDVNNEKTPYVSPLYDVTKHHPFAQFVRTYFLSKDKKEYIYYEVVKQLIWIVMSLGLVLAVLKYRADDQVNFISLSVFGGLLFLLIFEGGKTRYLIQFLPQILLLSAFGLTDAASFAFKRKGTKDLE